MSKNDLIIRIAGEGGEGIISSGDFIAAACARAGLEVYTFKTFPAEIKGGYAMYQIRISAQQLFNQGDSFDVFCAFNGEAYELNKHLLKPGTAFVYDSPGDFEAEIPEGVFGYPIPMSQTAKELKEKRSKNMVALGALSSLFNIQATTLSEVLSDKFAAKGEEVLANNLTAFKQGQEFGLALEKTDPWKVANPQTPKDVIITSGNEGIGLGALLGKLDFFSAYPITPATEIARYVAAQLPKLGGTLIQAEDEIASISQVLGASYAGKRAMTATSGPGLALMSEMIGMSFMSETPALIVDVQRGGPSTGLPTKHEQSDLFLAIHGSHGDAMRIVLSVENVKDCIDLTVQALNLADKYQTPVILLSDGSLAFSTQTVPRPKPENIEIIERKHWDGKGEYQRYQLTPDNISPMVDPGTANAMHIATGLEHNEWGNPNTTPEYHEKMTRKRFEKLSPLVDDFPAIEIDGDDINSAQLGIIAWGSTIGAVREAISRLNEQGYSIKGFYPKLLWPMAIEQYEDFASQCEKILIPEVNFQGQLAHFVRANTSIKPISQTLCGGLPFTPSMIVNKVKEILA